MIGSHRIFRITRTLACALVVLAVAAPIAHGDDLPGVVAALHGGAAPAAFGSKTPTFQSASAARHLPAIVAAIHGGIAPARFGSKTPTLQSATASGYLPKMVAALHGGTTSVATTATSPGFDWTPVAFAAGSAIALVALAMITALAVRRVRGRVAPAG